MATILTTTTRTSSETIDIYLSSSNWKSGTNSISFTINYNSSTARYSELDPNGSGSYSASVSGNALGSTGTLNVNASVSNFGDASEFYILKFLPNSSSGTFSYSISNIRVNGLSSSNISEAYAFRLEDSTPPTAAISLSDSILAKDEVAQVNITFNEAVTGLTLSDFSVSNATLSNLSSTNNINWTATLSPSADTNAAGSLTLEGGKYTDSVGNSNKSSASVNFTVDTQAPSAIITLSDTNLGVGEVANVIIQFNEAIRDFGNNDFSVEGGTLSNLSSTNNIIWTAAFTPTLNTKTAGKITLNPAVYKDNAGNLGTKAESKAINIDTFSMPAELPSLPLPGNVNELQLSLVELYIAYFNRSPDALGIKYWEDMILNNGWNTTMVARSFMDQPEVKLSYPEYMSTSEVVNKVYNNVLNRSPDLSGASYWNSQLNSGAVSRSDFIMAVINAAKSNSGSVVDAMTLANKAEVGAYFSLIKGLSDTSLAASIMQSVDSTFSSVALAKLQIDSKAQTTFYNLTSNSAFGQSTITWSDDEQDNPVDVYFSLINDPETASKIATTTDNYYTYTLPNNIFTRQNYNPDGFFWVKNAVALSNEDFVQAPKVVLEPTMSLLSQLMSENADQMSNTLMLNNLHDVYIYDRTNWSWNGESWVWNGNDYLNQTGSQINDSIWFGSGVQVNGKMSIVNEVVVIG